METFSALLALSAGNSPVSVGFPAQRPEARSFDVFFDLCVIKQLSKHSRGWWFETLSRPLWRHCNTMLASKITSTAFCGDPPPVTGEIYFQSANNAENFSITWRHHMLFSCDTLSNMYTYKLKHSTQKQQASLEWPIYIDSISSQGVGITQQQHTIPYSRDSHPIITDNKRTRSHDSWLTPVLMALAWIKLIRLYISRVLRIHTKHVHIYIYIYT